MIPQVLCTVVTSSQTPSQVVQKHQEENIFLLQNEEKALLSHGTNLPAPEDECSAHPAPSHPSPKGEFLPDGENKRGSQIPLLKCLQRAVGNPLESEQLSQCLCFSSPGCSGYSKARDAPAASLRKTRKSQLLNYFKLRHLSLTGIG